MYDVIVVGAGPAGCTASKVLAERGYRVLLVEKFKMPRYKSCSGQLIQKTLDLVQAYFGAPVPDAATCAPAENRGMIFTDDRGQSFRFEQSGRNVWRSSFDKWLADRAADAGAEVLDGAPAISLEPRGDAVTVTLKGRRACAEGARYVVDCEGVVGLLKRRLLGGHPQYIRTCQTFNRGSVDLDSHYFYAYLQPELSEYDAWMNVKDGQLVLGVSVRDGGRAEAYYARFIDYMRREHGLRIERQLKVDRWLMPRVQPGCPIDCGAGRILFAGEIAGFLNPMGEGISAAMESGHRAADAIARHFDDPDMVLASYRAATTDLHNYMKRQWNFVARMAGTFQEMKS